MNPQAGTSSQLDQFAGTAPLFPLPTPAIMPHVVQPLHVFEKRYRILTEHALESDRLVGMAVLRPGWETRYDEKDVPIYPVVCLSRIEAEHRLPDGRYLLLIRGLIRARVLDEFPSTLPYRQGHLELMPDVYATFPTIDRVRRRRELLEQFLRLHPACEEVPALPEIVETELSLGALSDVLAFAAGLNTAELLSILEEPRVDPRSDLLLDLMRRRVRECSRRGPTKFPPEFSLN